MTGKDNNDDVQKTMKINIFEYKKRVQIYLITYFIVIG